MFSRRAGGVSKEDSSCHRKSGPLIHKLFSSKVFAENPLEAASEGFRLLSTYLHFQAWNHLGYTVRDESVKKFVLVFDVAEQSCTICP